MVQCRVACASTCCSNCDDCRSESMLCNQNPDKEMQHEQPSVCGTTNGCVRACSWASLRVCLVLPRENAETALPTWRPWFSAKSWAARAVASLWLPAEMPTVSGRGQWVFSTPSALRVTSCARSSDASPQPPLQVSSFHCLQRPSQGMFHL